MNVPNKWTIGVVLYDGFELLDVFGPLEIFGTLPSHFDIKLIAEHSGVVSSTQGPKSVIDHAFDQELMYDILLVPGGKGSRQEVSNVALLNWLEDKALQSKIVASICTGSALLAKAGVLDDRRATTNKVAFEWVTQQGEKVKWVPKARWVEDGKFFTSSGVSAGMDMSLAIVAHLLGVKTANKVANWIEYEWHQDASWDPFSERCGLVERR